MAQEFTILDYKPNLSGIEVNIAETIQNVPISVAQISQESTTE